MSPKEPQPIRQVLTELMNRRGYARVQASAAFAAAWREAAGELLARQSRVGSVRRGALEVTVAHPSLAQELNFRKTALLDTLRRLLPQESIRDLRFRVGHIED